MQSFVMIGIQTVLLKVALEHRPAPSSKGGEAAIPFAGSRDGDLGASRPYNFWQWRSPKPYVYCLLLIASQLFPNSTADTLTDIGNSSFTFL